MSAGPPRGYLALVLHAHLPFVRHPEHEFFLEEDWFFEAITETYIPLLRVLEQLVSEGVQFRLTIVMSPPLLAMLDDQLLRDRYERHLQLLDQLVDSELRRTAQDGHLNYLARHYRQRINEVLETWREHHGDLVQPLARLQQRGYLDILTCGATHGYLPLMQVHPEAVWAQIKVAAEHYEQRFGQRATGIWLPECGYYSGLDRLLAAAGLRYFIADTHGLLFAEPRPRLAHYAPIYCPDSGVAAFGRDHESSYQVWSRDHGYPGDPVYREFYRDIGHDLSLEELAPYVRPPGIRKNTGIKYHRITGPTEHKELYDPYWGKHRALEHAEDFVARRIDQVERVAAEAGRPPLVVAPYDAELFGHWWAEGPWWLEAVLRKCAERAAQGRLATTHLREYLRSFRVHQVSQPAQSSWGERGFHEYWLNPTNEWIYPLLHRSGEQMIALARKHPRAEGLLRRALNQAARELLLAQASDWAFIMRTRTVVEYAVRRTRSHLTRFAELQRQIEANRIDADWLSAVEYLDNIFPTLDYGVYASAPRGHDEP